MGFNIDFKEFDEYQKKFPSMTRRFNKFLKDFLFEMAERIIAETKNKQSGHYGDEFKAFDTGAMTAAWRIEKDDFTTEQDVELTNKKGKKVSRTVYSQEGDVAFSGRGKKIAVVLSNPMEYATEIEYGHRLVRGSGENKIEIGWVDGHFMLTTSIENIQRQMPERFKQRFREFCAAQGFDIEGN